jgi:Fic family protein
MSLLRSTGALSRQTLQIYYGRKRFEQVAESNAIEGSTLSVGETELAVLKGVTLTGHDPRFIQDARHLDAALLRLNELAHHKKAVDLAEVKDIHGLILGGGFGAGTFRSTEVRIRGSALRPPRTWAEVMTSMEAWRDWSARNPSMAPVRAAVLHAWLTHIHPFLDGNGRTARAIGNLELIRQGYPPIIIKKTKHRDRYIDALQESDSGGNLSLFLDLMLDRLHDALRDLENAAAQGQGYDPIATKLRNRQERSLAVWNAAVELLVTLILNELQQKLEQVGGAVAAKRFHDSLTLDDFIVLCERSHAIRDSWSFQLECSLPTVQPWVRLAWFGYRSERMRAGLPLNAHPAPSIFWSKRNLERYPPWILAGDESPGGLELTLVGDSWAARRAGGIEIMSPSRMAETIARDVALSIAGG